MLFIFLLFLKAKKLYYIHYLLFRSTFKNHDYSYDQTEHARFVTRSKSFVLLEKILNCKLYCINHFLQVITTR